MSPKAILILGAGNFSAALEEAFKYSEYDSHKAHATHTTNHNSARARSLIRGTTLIATEYHTHAQSMAMYKAIDKHRHHPDPMRVHEYQDRFQSNINEIQILDGQVLHGFDATRYPSGLGQFDRIIFENPHTGTYGSDHNEEKNMQSVTSNAGFLEGILDQAAKHLTSSGVLELSVCGWPWIAKPSRHEKWSEGMDLLNPAKAEAIAKNWHLKFVDCEDLGKKRVERNEGDRFDAYVYRLRFQKRSH